MNFIKNIFGKKEEQIKNYSDFWKWFQKNEKDFFEVIRNDSNIEENFFNKLSPKLEQLKDGYFYLTGIFDDNTVELIMTADGNTKNIVFIEELIEQAPNLNGWKFTALKPAMNIEDVSIEMAGLLFDANNLFFYSNDLKNYPDEIDISIFHKEINNQNREEITDGVYIFLDNFLGEIEFVNQIDNLQIIDKDEIQKELIPINKLKDFLIWREKEFIEKYEGIRYDTENDEHTILEGKLKNENKLISVINNQLLNWDRQASHPWLAILTIKYDGRKNNGMPIDSDFQIMNNIEDELINILKDIDGYLNIGRQTGNNEREVYFACKDFRKPSKTLYEIQKKYNNNFKIDFDIYKDKYWKTFNRFKIDLKL